MGDKGNGYFSHITEQAILSILLNNPDMIYSIMETVSGEMFSSIINKTVYEAIVTLVVERGTPPSPLLVIGHLNDTQKLEGI